MRITYYLFGVMFIVLGTLALLPTLAKPDVIGFSIAASCFCIGVPFLIVGIKDYKGGLFCFFGIISLALSVFVFGANYHNYPSSNYEFFFIGLAVSSAFAIAGTFLAWLGYKRHRRVQAERLVQRAAPAESTEPTVSPRLYPPLKVWWLFGLLLFSFMLYIPFFTYRTIKDLDTLGGKKRESAFYAVGALFPVVTLFVYFEMASEAWKLSAQKLIPIKIPFLLLLGVVVLASATPLFMPRYLYPVSVAVLTIPWLLLQQQMNQLRRAHGDVWVPSAAQANGRQLGIMIIGIPLMILATVGAIRQSKDAFNIAQSKGEALASGDTLLGKARIYKLRVKGQDWKRVKPGTLYPDTELELLGKTQQDWVVARVLPNQKSTLDSIVDSRRTLVASNTKSFHADENRTLESGGKLTPLSFAHYTGIEVSSGLQQSVFVATVVTDNNIIEVVGHSLTENDKEVESLVGSLHLINQEN